MGKHGVPSLLMSTDLISLRIAVRALITACCKGFPDVIRMLIKTQDNSLFCLSVNIQVEAGDNPNGTCEQQCCVMIGSSGGDADRRFNDSWVNLNLNMAMFSALWDFGFVNSRSYDSFKYLSPRGTMLLCWF
ncbi:hypothetical protein PIB30_005747 [Stylosanthes scabra]|uniref:Uncharacterized protein n=1 Tax=Stylosanthes scabra TaxID=79078 RepID=A0ABU6W255_9FABA|nr:hypothetical protein [Stylosanthes scabra]